MQDLPVHLGAFVLGFIGILFPQTVSEKVIGIPAIGLIRATFP